MRISDWSSDVCSSDLIGAGQRARQRATFGRLARELALLGIQRRVVVPPGMDDALAIDQQQMLAPCAQIERQTHRRDASGAGPETYDARVLDPLALQLPRIEQIGRASCRDRGCQYEKISVGAIK